jgi:hypothetical protein
MSALDGAGFQASRLDHRIRDFYEHTARYRLEVWIGWKPLFWPGGELIARFFGRRVEQLSLPMRPLDVAQGMDSAVTVIRSSTGEQHAAAWLRTFGGDGAYVVVSDGGRTFAAQPPLRETFHVWVDRDGILRTDHQLRLWRAEVVNLHYRLDPV